MRRGLFVVLGFVALVSLGSLLDFFPFSGGWLVSIHRNEDRRFHESLQVFSDQLAFAKKLETSDEVGSSVDHLLRTLDENSEYLPKKDAVDFEIETEQRYGGIGVEVEWADERLTIVSPFADSPGELAGLRPGDQIIRVDGNPMDGKRYREVVDLLRGPTGSKVTFSVYRPSSESELDLEVIRQTIKVNSVRGVGMLEPGVGYIRITQFGTQTYSEFIESLETLESEGLNGLIVDLRNNPGGVLSAAVDIAGVFFDKGETVVYTKGKDSTHDKIYTASTPVRDGDYPIVILVNNGSASASEIVAGALQDVGRAKLVGTKTFGKGSVQTIFQYRSGDAMRLTTALFFTPGGRVIHEHGIEPDVVVPLSEEAFRKLMFQRRYLKALGPQTFTAKYGFEPIEDKQLEVALQVIRDRRLL